MRFTAISDTHTLHHKIKDIPPGDCIIHAGDIMNSGYDINEVHNFADWYGSLKFKYKILIAGNHDRLTDDKHMEQLGGTSQAKECEAILKDRNIIYLNDSAVTIEGIKIYGSPVTPFFCNWAWNRNCGADIKAHWDLIPTDVDILITHGPAKNILDKCPDGFRAGCADLLEAVKRIKPKYHIFGHIHGSANSKRTFTSKETTYINASVLDDYYKMTFKPQTFTFEKKYV